MDDLDVDAIAELDNLDLLESHIGDWGNEWAEAIGFALVAEVRRLRAENARLRDALAVGDARDLLSPLPLVRPHRAPDTRRTADARRAGRDRPRSRLPRAASGRR